MNVDKSQNMLYPFLKPISYLYSMVMRTRRKLLQLDFIKPYTSVVPTVSVGNISWGGTGKTPVVEFLASWALRKSLKATVLTRGYGGRPPYTPLIVSRSHTPSEVGDEALMLADSLPLAGIIVDPQRTRAAQLAEKHFMPDLFILDDGFQHFYLNRQLNIVLLNYNDLQKGWNEVIPAGAWREPASALEAADAFCIKTTRSDWEILCKKFEQRMGKYAKPFFGFFLQAIGIVPVYGEFNIYPPEILEKSPYIFATGIGNPRQAEENVIRLMGRAPEKSFFYKDHHQFTIKDSLELMSYKLPIICTHKDAVKLKRFHVINLWYVKIETFFGSSYGTSLSFSDWFTLWWEKQKEGVNEDKAGLEYQENAEYNGDSAAWGEGMRALFPETIKQLPLGWGPIEEKGETIQKIIYYDPADYAPKEKPEQAQELSDEAREKEKINYAFTLDENIRKMEQQEKQE